MAYSLQDLVDPSQIGDEACFGLLSTVGGLLHEEAAAAPVSWVLYWFQDSGLEEFVELLVRRILEMVLCAKWNHMVSRANLSVIINEL